MMYALDDHCCLATAEPGYSGVCPHCGEEVVAKCGRIVTWHWAHKADTECDPWWEPETDWHLSWKRLAPSERVEVTIGPHRADLLAPDGTAVELQHSSISADVIEERERFYGRMVWLIDGGQFCDRFHLRPKGDYQTFRWRWPRKSWFTAAAPMFIDLPSGIFEIRQLYPSLPERCDPETLEWLPAKPCGGWGYLRSRQHFIDRFIRDQGGPHA